MADLIREVNTIFDFLYMFRR